MPSDNYPFAIGRIKAVEAGVMAFSEIDQIAAMPYQAAVKLLADKGFGAAAEERADPDALIAAEEREVWAYIDEITPDPELTDLFKLEADAVNLKLLFKYRLLETDLAEAPLLPGVFAAEPLRACVQNSEYEPLGPVLQQELDEAEKFWAERANGDVGALSAKIDNAVYRAIFSRLKKLRNPLCTQYFAMKVDTTNLVSMLRAKTLGWPAPKLERMLIEQGGRIDSAKFCAALEAEPEAGNWFKTGDLFYDRSIAEVITAYQKAGEATAAHEAANDRLLELVKNDRNDSFGIGPVLYYLLRRLEVCRRLRLVFAKARAKQQ